MHSKLVSNLITHYKLTAEQVEVIEAKIRDRFQVWIKLHIPFSAIDHANAFRDYAEDMKSGRPLVVPADPDRDSPGESRSYAQYSPPRDMS